VYPTVYRSSVAITPANKSEDPPKYALTIGLIGAGLMTIDSVVDTSAYLNAAHLPLPTPSWMIVSAVVIALTIAEGLLVKILAKDEPEALATKAPEIDKAILSRWAAMQKRYGISRAEPRAAIQNFPNALQFITELHDTYLESSDRKQRKDLRTRIQQVMREQLDPLATELKFVTTSNSHMKQLVSAADADLATTLDEVRQAGNTAYANMLLKMEE